jgi:hypothetical protein
MQQVFLLEILLLAQHVSGHHYAHHQELESIIQLVAACSLWCLVFKLSVGVELRVVCPVCPQTGHSTLELLMMGIMVPETC